MLFSFELFHIHQTRSVQDYIDKYTAALCYRSNWWIRLGGMTFVGWSRSRSSRHRCGARYLYRCLHRGQNVRTSRHQQLWLLKLAVPTALSPSCQR